MARIVRGALLQSKWTGDKASMIQKHIEFARKAAYQGAQMMCFQTTLATETRRWMTSLAAGVGSA